MADIGFVPVANTPDEFAGCPIRWNPHSGPKLFGAAQHQGWKLLVLLSLTPATRDWVRAHK